MKRFILEKLNFFKKAFELKFALNNLKSVQYEFGIHFIEFRTKRVFTNQNLKRKRISQNLKCIFPSA